MSIASESSAGGPPTVSNRTGSTKTPAGMSSADVAFIRTRHPFAGLDPSAFSPANPLDKIIANETRLRRVVPGQVLVRKEDYGNVAMLVLAGTVSILHPSPRGNDATTNGPAASSSVAVIPASQRTPDVSIKRSLCRRLADCFARPKPSHTRDALEIRPDRSSNHQWGRTDRDVAMFMQDFDAVVEPGQSTALGPGEMFGEVATMYRTPHAATVVATEESAILEITWQGLRDLRRDKSFDASLDQHYRTHWLPLHLRENALLRYLDQATIAEIAAASSLKSYGRLKWHADYRRAIKRDAADQIVDEPIVVREGSYPTDLMIVRSGFGRASVDHGSSVRTTAYLGAGHMFGLSTIVKNCLEPTTSVVHQETLRAVGMLDVISIPIELVASHVMPRIRRDDLPENIRSLFPNKNRRTTKRASRDRRTEQSNATTSVGQSLASTSLMEFVVGNRLNNGPTAMVIDLDRCTHCDDCLTACATTHGGDARFKRQGPSHGRLQFASACMQCVDPVCMIGCPTGAITRESDPRDGHRGLVAIDEQTCIGCKTCASSCPYDNIEMAAIVDARGEPHIDLETDQPMLKAIKCDMCHDQPAGPACIAACPHDALVRIDLTKSAPLDQLLERR